MSQALFDAAAEARLLAFNLMIEAARGGHATGRMQSVATDMGYLTEAVMRGLAPAAEVRSRIAAVAGRGLPTT